MFRPMRRIKQQVSDDECKRVFKRECRFSFFLIPLYYLTVNIFTYYDDVLIWQRIQWGLNYLEN